MNSSETILRLYLALLTLQLVFEISLTVLNIRYVKARRDKVPEAFRGHIDQETYTKSVAYTLSKERFSIVSSLFSCVLLLFFILSGFFGRLDHGVDHYAPPFTYTHGVLFIIALSFISSVITLPLSLYSTFGIEQRFGFNRMSFGLWILDTLKRLLVSALVMVPVLYGLLWFMKASGSWWWIYAFAFISLVQLFVLYLYPVLIAPLFNKFSPLTDENLRAAIVGLSERLQFAIAGVFLMDGSRRSAHANAYFTGFGKHKRIVLFDTLVQKLSEEQTVAVLAHEIGHAKRGHIKKSLVLSFALLFVAFYFLSKLLQQPAFFNAFGFDRASSYAALTVFIYGAAPVLWFVAPLFSILSRRFEYEADTFACDAVGSARPLGQALIELSKSSLSNLTPHPLYSFFHYSHPTLIERLAALKFEGAQERAA